MNLIKENASQETDRFSELIQIMRKLRGKGGCPWDKEQDHDSIKPYLIEETYEVLEAIDEKNDQKLREELGDLILQVIFHAQIAQERKAFGIKEVLERLNTKLKSRHPHVFKKDVILKTPAEVLANWERIKENERSLKEKKQGVLVDLPKGLPALLMARRIQDKLSRQGKGIIKVNLGVLEEKFEAFRESLLQEDRERIEVTLADLLLVLVELARVKGVDAEDTLRRRLKEYYFSSG